MILSGGLTKRDVLHGFKSQLDVLVHLEINLAMLLIRILGKGRRLAYSIGAFSNIFMVRGQIIRVIQNE